MCKSKGNYTVPRFNVSYERRRTFQNFLTPGKILLDLDRVRDRTRSSQAFSCCVRYANHRAISADPIDIMGVNWVFFKGAILQKGEVRAKCAALPAGIRGFLSRE